MLLRRKYRRTKEYRRINPYNHRCVDLNNQEANFTQLYVNTLENINEMKISWGKWLNSNK